MQLIIPKTDESIKLLEDNREKASELTKEEQYVLQLLKVPGIMGHLHCLEIKFNFNDRFLTLNKQL